MGKSSSWLLATALVLAALSGCAGLSHELLWTRRLIDVLGASTEATTRVFGWFFGGLAMGAALVPWLMPHVRRPWRALAGIEAGVAVAAVPAATLPLWTGWIWPTLGPERLNSWQGDAIKFLISGAAVFPPALLMGMVVPIMVTAILRHFRGDDSRALAIYAINTLGGVVGLFAIALVVLPLLGAWLAMCAAIAMNVASAVGCLWLDRRYGVQDDTDSQGETAAIRPEGAAYAFPAKPQRRVFLFAVLMSAVSGAGVLGFEVLAVQLIRLKSPLSYFAPTAILGTVVLVLSLTAFLTPRALLVLRGPRPVLMVFTIAAAATALFTPWLFQTVTQFFEMGARDTLAAYMAVLCGGVMLISGPFMFSSGFVFPATLAWVSREGEDVQARTWGLLLAANGLGGLLAAEVMHSLLIPRIGVESSFGVVGLMYGLTALLIGVACQRSFSLVSLAAGFAAVGAVLMIQGTFSSLKLTDWKGVIVLAEKTGREGTVAVVESPDLGRRLVISNQYVLGGTKYRFDQARMGHVPMALHEHPSSVAFIGFATGITPSAALEHACVDSIVAADLSPLVVRFAGEYFQDYNQNILENPRAEVVVEDGRTFIAASPGMFDVVVGDLFLPWADGESRLYSKEHFQSVRASLAPKGIFCQWLAMYQFTPDQFQIVVDTFLEVFPRAYLFRNNFNYRSPALALVGLRDGELDWDRVRDRCVEIRRSGDVGDPLIRHVEGLQMLYLGSQERSADPEKPINTLANMKLELSAAEARVTMPAEREKYLLGEPWMRFTDERLQARERRAGLEDSSLEFSRLGMQIALWEAARLDGGVRSENATRVLAFLEREIGEHFPAVMRDDDGSDWAQWPGDTRVLQPVATPPP